MRCKIVFLTVAAAALSVAGRVRAQAARDTTVEAFRNVEVASVADAIEQLYGVQDYMFQDVRRL